MSFCVLAVIIVSEDIFYQVFVMPLELIIGPIVLDLFHLPVCSSVCTSVCLSVNFNLSCNFWCTRSTIFIFGNAYFLRQTLRCHQSWQLGELDLWSVNDLSWDLRAWCPTKTSFFFFISNIVIVCFILCSICTLFSFHIHVIC